MKNPKKWIEHNCSTCKYINNDPHCGDCGYGSDNWELDPKLDINPGGEDDPSENI